jgi:hypothetical protein
MYYQTKSIYKEGVPVTCKIIDNSDSKWVIEYYDNGNFVQTQVNPSEIISLDYCESELSQ